MKSIYSLYFLILLPIVQACSNDGAPALADASSANLTQALGNLDEAGAKVLRRDVLTEGLRQARLYSVLPRKISAKSAAENAKFDSEGCTVTLTRGSATDSDRDGIPQDVAGFSECTAPSHMRVEFEARDVSDADWESGFKTTLKTLQTIPPDSRSNVKQSKTIATFSHNEVTKTNFGYHVKVLNASSSSGRALNIEGDIAPTQTTRNEDGETLPSYRSEGVIKSVAGFVKLEVAEGKTVVLKVEGQDLKYSEHNIYGTYKFTDQAGKVLQMSRAAGDSSWKFVFDGKDL